MDTRIPQPPTFTPDEPAPRKMRDSIDFSAVEVLKLNVKPTDTLVIKMPRLDHDFFDHSCLAAVKKQTGVRAILVIPDTWDLEVVSPEQDPASGD